MTVVHLNVHISTMVQAINMQPTPTEWAKSALKKLWKVQHVYLQASLRKIQFNAAMVMKSMKYLLSISD